MMCPIKRTFADVIKTANEKPPGKPGGEKKGA